MQTRREKLGYEMMLLPCLEELVPADDRLRKLNRVLDLAFVHEAVRDRYCQDNGRGSIDPEVAIRLFLLQAIEGIRSTRELMRQVHANLTYRWFIGYGIMEKVPDHSTLSKALERLGDALFNELFERSIAQCRASGLVDGEVLHLDATVIRADLARDQVGRPGCADPDARFGRTADGTKVPSYKQQTVVDSKSRVVVAVEVLPGNAHDGERSVETIDQAIAHVGRRPAAVCADAAYANVANAAAMAQRKIRFVSPPQRRSAPGRGPESFTPDDFVHDEQRDVYVCPAKQILTYIGTERTGRQRRRYRAPRSVCAQCALKARCTRSQRRTLHIIPDRALLVQLREDAKTESFQELYRTRGHVIEGNFAEEKQWHGLRRAIRRGLSNMRVQCWLVAAVINFKRLAAALGPFLPFGNAVCVVLSAFLRSIRLVRRTCGHVTHHRLPRAATP
jgi:transposase